MIFCGERWWSAGRTYHEYIPFKCSQYSNPVNCPFRIVFKSFPINSTNLVRLTPHCRSCPNKNDKIWSDDGRFLKSIANEQSVHESVRPRVQQLKKPKRHSSTRPISIQEQQINQSELLKTQQLSQPKRQSTIRQIQEQANILTNQQQTNILTNQQQTNILTNQQQIIQFQQQLNQIEQSINQVKHQQLNLERQLDTLQRIEDLINDTLTNLKKRNNHSTDMQHLP